MTLTVLKNYSSSCIIFLNVMKNYFDNISDGVYFATATTWVAVLFSLYVFFSVGQLSSSVFIAIDTYSDFSNKVSWIPLALQVSEGRLFPLTTSITPQLDGFTHYPYLTIWSLGFLISMIGINNAVLISQIVFPTLAFLFSALSYRIWLSKGWAITLAALGSIAFTDYPFREFIYEFLSGSNLDRIGTKFRPDLINIPFPAINAFSFSLLFYLTFNNQRLSKLKITLLSMGWALQTQVHIVNAIFGIPFWLSYLFLRLLRQQRIDHNNLQKIIKIWSIQFLLILVICLPSLKTWLLWINFEFIFSNFNSYIGIEENIERFFSYQGIVYFFIPLFMTALLAVIKRIDPFEIFTRFWPIYILMAIEFLVVFFSPLFLGSDWITELIMSRISMFFLHMLYFIPFIFFSVRNYPDVNYSFGFEAKNFSLSIRSSINWFFNLASFFYLPIIFFTLSFFLIISNRHANNFYLSEQLPAINFIQQRMNYLKSQNISPGSLVADTNFAMNFNFHLFGYSSLLNNRFSNKISVEDSLERIVLYSRLAGWSEQDLLNFLTPSKIFFGNVSNSIINLTHINTPKGIGYWLIYNQTNLSNVEFVKLISDARYLYANMDVLEVSNRIGLRFIISDDSVPGEFHAQKYSSSLTTSIYILNFANH